MPRHQRMAADGFLLDFVENTMPNSLRRFVGASDLVQSIWIKVQKYGGNLAVANENQYRAWVLCIARRKIIDKLRRFRLTEAKRRLDSERGLPSGHYSLTCAQPDASHVIGVREDADRLLAALLDLPTDIQHIVALRYRDEMSFCEISEHLRIPVTTCRRRWLEGCEMLRFKLSDILER